MSEYDRHLETYKNYWFSDYSALFTGAKWDDEAAAARFLAQYWLSSTEYEEKWQPIEQKMFLKGQGDGNLFTSEYELFKQTGGCLFCQSDFEDLMRFVNRTEDRYFVVIQDGNDFNQSDPQFRLKFPTSTTWDDLLSGSYISAVVFEMHYNNFKVYGKSAEWGKYSGTDWDPPLDIYGIGSHLVPLFAEEIAGLSTKSS